MPVKARKNRFLKVIKKVLLHFVGLFSVWMSGKVFHKKTPIERNLEILMKKQFLNQDKLPSVIISKGNTKYAKETVKTFGV